MDLKSEQISSLISQKSQLAAVGSEPTTPQIPPPPQTVSCLSRGQEMYSRTIWFAFQFRESFAHVSQGSTLEARSGDSPQRSPQSTQPRWAGSHPCLPPSWGKISGEGTWALWSVHPPEPLGCQRFGGVHRASVQEGKGNLVPISRALFICVFQSPLMYLAAYNCHSFVFVFQLGTIIKLLCF